MRGMFHGISWDFFFSYQTEEVIILFSRGNLNGFTETSRSPEKSNYA